MTEKYGTKNIFCSQPCKKKFNVFVGDDELVARYENGESIQDIANSTGIKWATIRNGLLRKGVKMRSRAWHLSTDKNPTKGKGHTEEAKEKIRQANLLQFSDPQARERASHNQAAAMSAGKISKCSKIEAMVASELDRLGIEYRQQVPLRDPATGRFFACVDFLLADGRVLEVQGGFWHADPRLYPNGPVKESQKNTAENDKRRRSRMADLGIPVVVVWELDIKADIEKAISTALPS